MAPPLTHTIKPQWAFKTSLKGEALFPLTPFNIASVPEKQNYLLFPNHTLCFLLMGHACALALLPSIFLSNKTLLLLLVEGQCRLFPNLSLSRGHHYLIFVQL
jgi:hypothetical protein